MNRLDGATASQIIAAALRESMAVKALLIEQHLPTIARITEMLAAAFRSGGKVVLFGNGGSAADAQHVAAEMVNRFLLERRALPAMALTTDTSILTSMANDAGFERVFARQVEALVCEGDVAIALSTSGNSPNVLDGILAARERGAKTIGFTGRDGGKLVELVDICFCVPSDSTPRIQEAHVTVLHAICEVVEQELFG
jgi:D-sedoheptulose 7-phosphate isomerase